LFSATAINVLDDRTVPSFIKRTAQLMRGAEVCRWDIALGMPAWHAALADAGVTVEQNWVALSTRK
jgi:hypothetical protein